MTVDSTKIQLGVCDVSFNGTDLGATKGGVEVDISTSTYEVKVDQYGETPLKEVIIGTMVTVKVPLAETDMTRLNTMLAQSVISASLAAPTGAWAASAGFAVGLADITVTVGTGTPAPGHTFKFANHATIYRVVTYNTPVAGHLYFVQAASGAGGLVAPIINTEAITFFAKSTGVEIRSGVNTDLITIAAVLLLHPTGAGNADNDFTLFKAAPVGNFTFKFDTGSERIYEVTFKGYVDISNSGRIAKFGQ